MKLTFISDPAHGWLKVPVKYFPKYNIDMSKITPFSYIRKDFLYLEEDSDAPYFLKELDKQNIKYSFNEKTSNKSSKIRSYERFIFNEDIDYKIKN